MKFAKIMFSGPGGKTAELIINDTRFDCTINELSCLFPYSEANKMHTFYKSPVFETWRAAFDFDLMAEMQEGKK